MAETNNKTEENIIYIGKKPSLAYVLTAVTQFSNGRHEIRIKARGRAIQKAVDVAEIVRSRFVHDAKIKDIKIATEQVQSEGKGKLNISTIEIALAK